MKNFSFSLVLLSFFGVLIRLFLPKGEKSALYAPLKFLLSLAVILCIFSPVFRFFKSEITFPKISVSAEKLPNGEELIRQRLEERIYEHTKAKFEDAQFSLTLSYMEGYIPEKVLILCEDERKAQNIKDYIKLKFGLEAEIM